jgi:hypothetical protein
MRLSLQVTWQKGNGGAIVLPALGEGGGGAVIISLPCQNFNVRKVSDFFTLCFLCKGKCKVHPITGQEGPELE